MIDVGATGRGRCGDRRRRRALQRAVVDGRWVAQREDAAAVQRSSVLVDAGRVGAEVLHAVNHAGRSGATPGARGPLLAQTVGVADGGRAVFGHFEEIGNLQHFIGRRRHRYADRRDRVVDAVLLHPLVGVVHSRRNGFPLLVQFRDALVDLHGTVSDGTQADVQYAGTQNEDTAAESVTRHQHFD